MSGTAATKARPDDLPTVREALRVAPRELNALRPRHERDRLGNLLGRGPYPAIETRPVARTVARGLASRGCVKMQGADAALVVFRDRVAVVQDRGNGSLVHLFSEASEADPRIPASEILARSGCTWVSASDVSHRMMDADDGNDANDPGVEVVRRRLADLLVAATVERVAMRVVDYSPSKGQPSCVAILPDDLPVEEQGFTERVARHALRCASAHPSSGWVWGLQSGAPPPVPLIAIRSAAF